MELRPSFVKAVVQIAVVIATESQHSSQVFYLALDGEYLNRSIAYTDLLPSI